MKHILYTHVWMSGKKKKRKNGRKLIVFTRDRKALQSLRRLCSDVIEGGEENREDIKKGNGGSIETE